MIYADFDISPDGSRIASSVDNSTSPAEIWIVNVNGNGRARVSNAKPQFDEFAVAKSESVHWKGPDNFDVEGWVTYPLDYQAGKKVPMILSIHGGPYGANTAEFRRQRFKFSPRMATRCWLRIRAAPRATDRNSKPPMSPIGAARISRISWPAWTQ